MTRATDPVLILIFRGTHQVLSAEKRLKGGGVPLRLIPVPDASLPIAGSRSGSPRSARPCPGDPFGSAAAPRVRPPPREGGEYDPVSL